MTLAKKEMKHPMLRVFLTAFVLFLVGIIPVLINSKGVYVWLGDYQIQTIVFIERIHRMLHSGQGLPVFDWGSLLGMDFLTAYRDHLCSPFDWILYALPYAAVPYAHTFFMAGKIGLAAVTAYGYCRQYVKTDQSAFICGLLYALSGFQIFNLVYQFSDRYLMFPLLLYCFDQLVTKRVPFIFAAMMFLNNFLDTYFAWMCCVFLLVYYIVRTATGSFPRLTLKLFIRLAIETVFGVFSAAVVMLPSLMILSDNTRASNLIFGNSLLAYQDSGVILNIIQSVFMLPAICRNAWYFKADQVSLSPPLLYIPLFTVIGVILIWKRDRRAWYHHLLTVCAVIACVPVLNSAFSAFNNNYYARWFYMPLLIMIMMTGKYLDDFESFQPRRLLLTYAAILGFWILYGIYSVYFETPSGIGKDLWIAAAAIAVLALVILYLLHFPYEKIRFFSIRFIRPIACIFCLLPLLSTSLSYSRMDNMECVQRQRDQIWNDFQPVELEGDEFFRVVGLKSAYLNQGMMWDYPTLNFFNSMISGETCHFFEEAGVRCYQDTMIEKTDYALSSFLSVKYDLYYNSMETGRIEIEPEDVDYHIEGFEQDKVMNRYISYRNKAFIPMGYTFDYYLEEDIPDDEKNDEEKLTEIFISLFREKAGTEDKVKEIYDDRKDRQKLLLKAIWLSKPQITRYGKMLEKLPKEKRDDVSIETYYKDCADRAASACYEFNPNNHGFTARIDLPKENLVFFSVPYSKYFTAYVDGEPAEIERVYRGLCAVYAPEGDHMIEFKYETPGLKLGAQISILCASLLLLYTADDLWRKYKAKKKKAAAAAE